MSLPLLPHGYKRKLGMAQSCEGENFFDGQQTLFTHSKQERFYETSAIALEPIEP